MLKKTRLLNQFGLSTHMDQPFSVAWIRSQDLFGDRFSLRAEIGAKSIRFDYSHTTHLGAESLIWSFGIELSLSGRARVAYSDGIQPALKTVYRAAALVEQATSQLQANPSVNTRVGSATEFPATRIPRAKNAARSA